MTSAVIPAAFDAFLQADGLRLTDQSSLAYQAAVDLGTAIAEADPAVLSALAMPAAFACVEAICEYEHGSADWPCDPAAYVTAAVDVTMCIILRFG